MNFRRSEQTSPAYIFPGDAFPLIFLLLLLQHQLDEKLLQLLIAVVDAELFKAAGDTEVISYSNNRKTDVINNVEKNN